MIGWTVDFLNRSPTDFVEAGRPTPRVRLVCVLGRMKLVLWRRGCRDNCRRVTSRRTWGGARRVHAHAEPRTLVADTRYGRSPSLSRWCFRFLTKLL